MPRIFDRFYQSEQPNAKIQGGTGIGLALAKDLAELQGGVLKVESELGKGSIFKFIFSGEPIEISDLEKRPSEINLDQLHELLEDTVSRYSVLFEKAKPLILIVEDHVDMQAFIKRILERHFELLEAANGEEALNLLSEAKVDLVVSDVMMPKMDGFELLEVVKKEEALNGLSMIMLTARAAEEDKLFALTMGVDDYLTKPFSAAELLARIKNILENRMNRLGVEEPDEILSADEKFVREIKGLVHENIAERILNVAYLASEMALSERQLLRRLKSATGLTPIQFIREVRLLQAKGILERKATRTVAEVSYAVGFDTTFYFTSQFAARFGKNPSEYLS